MAIIVSHDREFLDGLVSKVYEFGGGKVREHLGGIYDWLKSPLQLPRKGESAENLSLTSSKSNNNQNVSPLPSEGSGEASGEALSYAERKELQKKIRKAQRAVDESEAKIAKLEARKSELDERVRAVCQRRAVQRAPQVPVGGVQNQHDPSVTEGAHICVRHTRLEGGHLLHERR